MARPEMHLTAAELSTLLRPSRCDLRVFLRERGVPEDPPDPYEQVLERLGRRHEQNHLQTLGPFLDLNAVPMTERLERTREALDSLVPIIYQGALQAVTTLGQTACEVLGVPDFLILDGNNYHIRDSKIAKRITEEAHPEILRQVETYGWLYEQSVGRPPAGLQVHSGPGDLVNIPYDGGEKARDALEQLVRAKQLPEEPYSPVGWTRCSSCAFGTRCLGAAEVRKDPAWIDGVDQRLATALHEIGVNTIQQLLDQFNETKLSEFKRPYGQRLQKVGKAAFSILMKARVLVTGEKRLLVRPELPFGRNYVMFDLEGLPPQMDELGKIYLWGMQVFGERPGEFRPAVATFGPNGDEAGWRGFLSEASAIFAEYGDIPFVHWSPYERTWLKTYSEKYGDSDGIAVRVRENLLDLLPITKEAVVLPVPSYSLKVIEKYIGFERTMDEYGGSWAMAQYIEAVETGDEAKRREIMDKILLYNKEDLAATWAVWRWLSTL